MADYVLVDTATLPGSGAVQNSIIAGEALTAGTPIYRKASDQKAYKADANVTAAEAAVMGFTANNAAPGQKVNYFEPGSLVTVSAVLAIGDVIYLSATAGKITADVPASLSFISIMGIALTASSFVFNPLNSGIQKP